MTASPSLDHQSVVFIVRLIRNKSPPCGQSAEIKSESRWYTWWSLYFKQLDKNRLIVFLTRLRGTKWNSLRHCAPLQTCCRVTSAFWHCPVLSVHLLFGWIFFNDAYILRESIPLGFSALSLFRRIPFGPVVLRRDRTDVGKRLQTAGDTPTSWQAASYREAAVLPIYWILH
jgi:hypothetical protein